jgi:opacity protein-like surface antigen
MRISQSTLQFQAGLDWEAARDFSFEALYKYSRSALESASGFRFEEFRAGVNYLF